MIMGVHVCGMVKIFTAGREWTHSTYTSCNLLSPNAGVYKHERKVISYMRPSNIYAISWKISLFLVKYMYVYMKNLTLVPLVGWLSVIQNTIVQMFIVITTHVPLHMESHCCSLPICCYSCRCIKFP